MVTNDGLKSSIWKLEEVYTSPDSPLFPAESSEPSSEFLGKPKVFSAVDMVAYATMPTRKTYRLGNLATLSISSHRDKFPVTSLGSIKPKGFTSGHRVVGGTIVFSSYDRNVWFKMIEGIGPRLNPNQIYRIMPDNMPLFDIIVTFVNEDGDIATTGLLGVSILDEGQTYSMENIAIMESYSYMAIDKIPFQPAIVSKSD